MTNYFICDRIRCVAGQLCWCGSMAEQLICNQQVDGSTPFTSSNVLQLHMGDFPSGQRGQTVNLLSTTSLVRIQHPPPQKRTPILVSFFVLRGCEATAAFSIYRKSGSQACQKPLSTCKQKAWLSSLPKAKPPASPF